MVLGLLFAPMHVDAGDIRLSWSASPDPSITRYEIRYGTASGQYTTTLSVGTQLNGTITGLTNGLPYYFVVRACNSAACSSPSNEVIGVTAATTFTDVPVVAGVTSKAVHITELRARIDRLRTLTNALAPASWSEPIVAGSTSAKATHITEMRTALAQAYVAKQTCGASPGYATDPTLTPGTLIKAAHVAELRTAVERLEACF
jgi:hypothetical protein